MLLKRVGSNPTPGTKIARKGYLFLSLQTLIIDMFYIGQHNKFIAKENIVVVKPYGDKSILTENGDRGYIDTYTGDQIELNDLEVSLHLIKPKPVKEQGRAVISEDGLAVSNVYGKGVKAIIFKGSEFWIEDNLSRIISESLYITDQPVLYYPGSPILKDYMKEYGVDVYLKSGKRKKLSEKFDPDNVIGVFGKDDQVISLETRYLNILNNSDDELFSLGLGDFCGYENTKKLKNSKYRAGAIEFCELLGKDWYIPAHHQLIGVFENLLQINFTLRCLGKRLIDFDKFISSTMVSSHEFWSYRSGYFCSNTVSDCVVDARQSSLILPFLKTCFA